jgi:hypothetical protein
MTFAPEAKRVWRVDAFHDRKNPVILGRYPLRSCTANTAASQIATPPCRERANGCAPTRGSYFFTAGPKAMPIASVVLLPLGRDSSNVPFFAL